MSTNKSTATDVLSVQPILSLSACIKLNLVKRVFVVTSSDTANTQDSLMEEYKDCFEGLGCLPVYIKYM